MTRRLMSVPAVSPGPQAVPGVHRVMKVGGLGLALGALSILADGLVPWRVLTTLGNIASPWVIAAFAAGRLARSMRAGAAAGTAVLVIATVVYYLGSAFRSGLEDSALELRDLAAVGVWLVTSLLVGPVVGAAGAASTRPRPAVWAVSAPAALVLAECFYLVLDRRPWRWSLPEEVYRLADAGVLVVLVGFALALPYRLMAEPERRRLAYAAVTAGGLVGAVGIVLLYRLI